MKQHPWLMSPAEQIRAVTAEELEVLRICAAPLCVEVPGLELAFRSCAAKGWIACDWFGYWWPTAAGYMALSEAGGSR